MRPAYWKGNVCLFLRFVIYQGSIVYLILIIYLRHIRAILLQSLGRRWPYDEKEWASFLFPVFFWTDAHNPFKGSVEMGYIIKSSFVADVRDGGFIFF